GAHVQPEAVERLADDVVLAKGGLAAKALAVGRPGEMAGMHRHAVDMPERVAGGQPLGLVPLQALLDGPQIGRLADERGAVDTPQAGEGGAVVLAEVPE